MNPITTAISGFVGAVLNIPSNLTNAAAGVAGDISKIVTNNTSERLAEIMAKNITDTLEGEGYDVTVTVNVHIKNH